MEIDITKMINNTFGEDNTSEVDTNEVGGENDVESEESRLMSETNNTEAEAQAKELKYSDEDVNEIIKKKLTSKKTMEKIEEMVNKKVEEALNPKEPKKTAEEVIENGAGSTEDDKFKVLLEEINQLKSQVANSKVEDVRNAKINELVSGGLDEEKATMLVENWSLDNLDDLSIDMFKVEKVTKKVPTPKKEEITDRETENILDSIWKGISL